MPTFSDIVNNNIISDSNLYTLIDRDILYNNLYSVISINNITHNTYTKEVIGVSELKDYILSFDYRVLVDHLMNFQDFLLLYDNGFGIDDETLIYAVCKFNLVKIREYFICLYYKQDIFDLMFKFIELGGQPNKFRIVKSKEGYVRIY